MLAPRRLRTHFFGTPCIGIHGRGREAYALFTFFHEFWEMISGVQ